MAFLHLDFSLESADANLRSQNSHWHWMCLLEVIQLARHSGGDPGLKLVRGRESFECWRLSHLNNLPFSTGTYLLEVVIWFWAHKQQWSLISCFPQRANPYLIVCRVFVKTINKIKAPIVLGAVGYDVQQHSPLLSGGVSQQFSCFQETHGSRITLLQWVLCASTVPSPLVHASSSVV